MALPTGVTTCVVTAGAPLDFAGQGGTITLTVTPILGGNATNIVWQATGQPLVNFPMTATADATEQAQVVIPHSDQAGFVNGAGDAFSGWSYKAQIVFKGANRQQVAWTKVFQIPSGQTSIDLDLVPDGSITSPTTAPIELVTSVNGQTGAVTVESALPDTTGATTGDALIYGNTGPEWGPGATDATIAGYVTGGGETQAALKGQIASGVDAGTAGADLMPVQGAVETAAPATLFLAYMNGYVYGYSATGGILRRSADDGATWSDVHTFNDTPTGIAKVSDGEVVLVCDGGLHRSTGWSDDDPATATWAQTATPSHDDTGLVAASFIGTDWDVWGQYVILGEYCNPRNNARRVRLSTDGGATFSTVFDLNTYYSGQDANTHIHGVAIDGFKDGTPRLWFTHGDGPRGVFCSDDLGVTWTMLPGTDADNWQFMALRATEHGMVVNTDSNAPDGVYRIPRTTDPAEMALELIAKVAYPYANGSLLGFGSYSWRDPSTGLVWMGFTVNTPAEAGSPPVPAYLFVTDGLRATLAWSSEQTSTTADNASVTGFAITPSGKLLLSYSYGAQPKARANVIATVGGRGGRPYQQINDGNALTGRVLTRDSVAIGPGVIAQGQSVLIGSGTSQSSTNGASDFRAVVVGDSANAGSQAVAIGYKASAPPTHAVVIGATASASGVESVAIGYGAAAATNGVAIGKGAVTGEFGSPIAIGLNAKCTGNNSTVLGVNATATSSAVAIGTGATAGSAGSVALGAFVSATASAQIAIGNKHIEMQELSNDPAAPAVNNARLYVKDDGAGNTILCVRTAAGVKTVTMT